MILAVPWQRDCNSSSIWGLLCLFCPHATITDGLVKHWGPGKGGVFLLSQQDTGAKTLSGSFWSFHISPASTRQDPAVVFSSVGSSA